MKDKLILWLFCVVLVNISVSIIIINTDTQIPKWENKVISASSTDDSTLPMVSKELYNYKRDKLSFILVNSAIISNVLIIISALVVSELCQLRKSDLFKIILVGYIISTLVFSLCYTYKSSLLKQYFLT